MKKETKRKIKAVAAAGVLGVATMFGATGCPNGSTNPSPCACVDEEHLGFNENCGCGGTSCNCRPKNYDYLMSGGGVGIEIYRDKSITNTDMENYVKDVLKIGFDKDTTNVFTNPTVLSKIKEIRIVLNPLTANCTPTGDGYIIEFSTDLDGNDVYGELSTWVGNGTITQIQQKDVIRLANRFDSSRISA